MNTPDLPNPDLPPLREVIAIHGLIATKALGQNFLFDEQLLARIAAVPGKLAGLNVLEVGPGPVASPARCCGPGPMSPPSRWIGAACPPWPSWNKPSPANCA